MIQIRAARETDIPALGRMGAGMVRFHHNFDHDRFILPEGIEEGYGWWLGKELTNPKAVVLVAEDEADVVGYVYATLEDIDWALLLGPHAGFHDIWVEDRARRRGVARMLVEAALNKFKELGAQQVVLMTATQNEAAQSLAAEFGFRQTMIEMTKELGRGEFTVKS